MTSEELKSARLKLKLTQEELSTLLGVDRRIITDWESGRRPIELLAKLAVQHLRCIKRGLHKPK